MTPSPLFTESDLREILLAVIRYEYGNTQARWARQHRIAASRVSDFLQGSAPTKQIVAAMGYEVECRYAKIDKEQS